MSYSIDSDTALEIFHAAPTPYLVLAPDLTIVGANEARLKVTDTTLEGTVGRYLFDAFPDNPDDLIATGVSNLRASLETVLKTKKPHRMAIQKYDIEVPTPEGTKFQERYWSPLNFPILNKDGSIKYIIHQVEDVTEQELSRKQVLSMETLTKPIETERARLLLIFEQAPIGICLMKGPDLIIEFANKTYRKISGEKRELDGLPLAKAFSDIGPDPIAHTLETFRTGKNSVQENMRITTDWDHTGKPYEKIFFVLLEPLMGPDGRPEGVITLAYDNTEKIRSRLEARKSLEDLRREKNLRERFVATLTHDLRTPLTAAKVNAHIISKKAEDVDTVRKYSEKIIHVIDRCDQMILNLLDANRIKAGEKIQLEKSHCSLKGIVEETMEELTTIHGERFIVQTPSDNLEGFWSSVGIKRILENLCNNAVKYGSKTEMITVHLKDLKNNVCLEVKNKGNVISEDDQEHLFDLHSRADAEIHQNEKGWGLGLTLVKGLTEAHGGTVKVSSSEEQGTIFKITLPKTAD